jgi:hypothetical protein
MTAVPDRGNRRLRIYFVSYALHMPAAHYRLLLPAQALVAAGHECVVGTEVVATPSGELIGVTPGEGIVRKIDLLVVQPGAGSNWTALFAGARRAGQRVVVDLDDWWWDLQRSSPAATGDVASWLPTLRAMVGASDLVTVSTPFLADLIGEWPGHPPVRVLRNAIDLGRWPAHEQVSDGPVLGYAGALSGHAEDMSLLAGWLPAFVERHDLRVVHIGSHPTLPGFAELTGVDPDRVTVRDGRPWDSYAASRPFAGVDIGLVPLEGRDYNRCKSALKGMEYAACGVPFVASPSPEYEWLGCGVLAGSSFEEQRPEDWVGAVESLLDPEARAQIASIQSERVAREDVGARWQEWEDTYRQLFDE